MRTRQVRERTAKGSRQRPLLGVLASGAPLRCLPKIIAWLRQLWALAGSACRLLCLTFPCPTVSHANVKVRFVVRVWWWILVVMGFGLPCLARLRGMMRVCICFLFFLAWFLDPARQHRGAGDKQLLMVWCTCDANVLRFCVMRKGWFCCLLSLLLLL